VGSASEYLVHYICKCCRISERLSTSVAKDDVDKVAPPKSVPNPKPSRGRPRKVFCSPHVCLFVSLFVSCFVSLFPPFSLSSVAVTLTSSIVTSIMRPNFFQARFTLELRISHTHTVVRECCKDDDQCQWERPKFDPPPPLNPLTDRHQNLPT